VPRISIVRLGKHWAQTLILGYEGPAAVPGEVGAQYTDSTRPLSDPRFVQKLLCVGTGRSAPCGVRMKSKILIR
jgi:hypothetical protein